MFLERRKHEQVRLDITFCILLHPTTSRWLLMDGSLAKPHACHTPATKGSFNNDGSGKWHLEGHMSYTFPLQKENCPLPCLLDSGWSPDWSVFVAGTAPPPLHLRHCPYGPSKCVPMPGVEFNAEPLSHLDSVASLFGSADQFLQLR